MTPSHSGSAVADPPVAAFWFITPTPVCAVLSIPAGRIDVVASDRVDTTVEIRASDSSVKRDMKAAQRAVIEYTGNVMRIELTTRIELMGPSGSVAVTIRLPSDSLIEAKSDSAVLSSVGRLQEVAFDGALGTVEVEEAADVHVTSAVGNVRIGRLDGDAHVSTAQGDIRIDEVVRGRLILRTQVGSISVTAAAGVSAFMEAGATVGRVRNALESISGTPEVTIRATTVKGDITARTLNKEHSPS
ncbi:MAG: DUF4097 family beta strand repeat protein [Catenulispora sp.]|nr:DUF4097 family beta strand repeat protein [Catenulispora sp.]